MLGLVLEDWEVDRGLEGVCVVDLGDGEEIGVLVSGGGGGCREVLGVESVGWEGRREGEAVWLEEGERLHCVEHDIIVGLVLVVTFE